MKNKSKIREFLERYRELTAGTIYACNVQFIDNIQLPVRLFGSAFFAMLTMSPLTAPSLLTFLLLLWIQSSTADR